MKTKGEIEAEVSRAIVQFEIDYMGRGPRESRAYLVHEMVVVRLKGVLTPAEHQLAKTQEGAELVKRMRAMLIDKAKPLLYQVVSDIVGIKSSICTPTSAPHRRSEFLCLFWSGLWTISPRKTRA